jgi:ketosteroid isomerase-like protein
MSEENGAIVRELVEAFGRGDYEAAFERYHPEIEWDTRGQSAVVPDLAGIYHGHEGVRDYWRRWLSAWRDTEFDIADVLDGGDEIVVLIRNQRMLGRQSGVPAEVPAYGLVFTVRNGLVVRWRAFADEETALAAAGIG